MAEDLSAENSGRSDRIQIAIVGGGCAGMAAAWQLSKQEGYEIHVYEKGWRLGGKSASIRNTEGRILEHGLHVWLGFYENAFRMMRECYEEVGRRGLGPAAANVSDRLVHGRFEDAFFPEPNVGVAHPDVHGEWAAWSALFPPEPGLPGEPMDEKTNPFTIANYLLRSISLLKTLILSVIRPPADDVPGGPRPNQRSTVDEALNREFSVDGIASLRALIERTAALLRSGTLTSAAVLMQAVRLLEAWLENLDFAPQVADSAVRLAQAVAAQTRKLLADAASFDVSIRIKTEIIDIVLTILVGLFRDRVMFDDNGLDSINAFDYRDWLRQNGTTAAALESRFLTGIYDFVFAYRDGDKAKPALAAGVALRGALRMFFTYRGSIFWRMRSGMGEAVFAPLYKVLSTPRQIQSSDGKRTWPASPVHFHFLHRLHSVDIDPAAKSARRVRSLNFELLGDADTRRNLEQGALDGFGCWPDQTDAPDVEGEKHKVFDAVIFAMGIDDIKTVFAEGSTYSALPSRWATMFNDVKTVATQSAQVWLDKDLEALGWYRGEGLITALGLPFDTWADMTHTLATERAYRQGRADKVRSVAYFCAALSEIDISGANRDEAAMKQQIWDRLDEMLQRDMSKVWPALEGASNVRRWVVDRHVQANFKGSDRYTLSQPGSIASRISPLDRTFENATIAGDWTACGLDAGCIEAAVMSGMLAAHAISGEPDLSSIIGYDHP